MLRARVGRREQEKDEVNRQIVHRLEVDRLRQAGEQAGHLPDPVELGMRQRNAAAEAGRSEFLPIRQLVGDRTRRRANQRCGRGAEQLEQHLLGRRRDAGKHGVGPEQIA